MLQTEHTDVNTILNERAVETLPNLNRNFTAFELLTPGTTYIGWGVDESQNPQRSQQIEVNGQLPFATGYELDGTDNQDPVIGIAVINPNLDAVSEMKVTSQNYDAEFGKAVAGLVTAQTKSGSNNLHGSAFEFWRSDALQARDPFSQSSAIRSQGRYIPTNDHNQFGGSRRRTNHQETSCSSSAITKACAKRAEYRDCLTFRLPWQLSTCIDAARQPGFELRSQ